MTDQPTPHARLATGHLAMVQRYLTFLGCPRSHLDDIVQETFLAALQAGIIDQGQAAGWLRVAAKFRLGSLWRTLCRPTTSLEDADRAWDQFHRDDEGTGWIAALRECVEQLPLRSQAALRCRYEEGLSMAATAARLHLSSNGAESLLVRLRRSLRQCVEGKLA